MGILKGVAPFKTGNGGEVSYLTNSMKNEHGRYKKILKKHVTADKIE